MVRSTPGEQYTERLQQYEAALKRQNRSLGYIGLLRLATFILVFFFLVMAIRNDLAIMYLITGLLVILFFLMVSYHKNQSDKRNLLRELVTLNRKELECQEYRFDRNESGSAFQDHHHPWSFDLDIFGEGSLYQFMNRTSTSRGSVRMAELLTAQPGSAAEIERRQEIVRELSEKQDFRQFYTSRAKLIDPGKESTQALLEWAGESIYIKKYRWLFYIALAISCLSLFVIVSGIFDPSVFNYLIIILLFNWMLLSPFLYRNNRDHQKISRRHEFLGTYAILLEMLSGEEFNNDRLRHLSDISRDGSKAIRKLSGLLNMFDTRLNMLLGAVFNSLFLFDFIMLWFISRWKDRHNEHLQQWIEAIGETEAYISLAGFAFNHPEYVYPDISEERRGLQAGDIGHPLIPSGKRIGNSIRITEEKIVLITGANMAGKSTFLRSVGINLVLAYAGCPVCATSMETGYYQLFSSMRTSDSLKDEESYFLAEILRLKRIVERMEQGDRLLILLDEVLKGTNTTDKQKGSRGLIEKSLLHDILCFIATHDLSLGEMEKEHPGEVVNYCFESYLGEEDVSFDYKIRPGVARNMNASFLMKKMGIMD